MAARSTRVTIHNELAVPLCHVSDSLEGGEWTDPLTPPREIPPGQTMWFQSESDGVATGTEGHATYTIGAGPDTITLHWDNPYVGTNFYEQSITGAYGIYSTGGKGDNTEIVYHVIPDSRVAVPGYLPSTHGFAFANHWPSIHITSISLPDPFGDIAIGNASWGLCGGMSYASRDYFEAGLHAPWQTTNPRGEGDPLFDYIVRRLAASLDVGDVADFVKYSDPAYADTDDVLFGDGRDWQMAHRAWPGIRDVIDSGHPCPIGIVTGYLPDVTHVGHQVCAYAYQLQGQRLTLWVYDPNSPKCDDITMSLDISRTDQHLIDVTSNINVGHSVICFFTQSYDPRPPVSLPPAHLDVFWIGPDGGVGTTWADPGADNGAWHTPFPIAPGGAARPDSPIAAVTRLNGQLDVFWIGPDGGIGTTWADPGADNGAWHTPFPIAPGGAARPDSPIAAVTRLNGQLDVFWIGPDGGVGTTWADPGADNGAWHTPFPIAPGGAARPDSPIAAVTRLNGQLDVFWIGPDGGIGTTWADPGADNGAWHTPFPIAPGGAARPDSPIAAVTRLNGQLDVFWIGPDGGIGTTWADPGADNGAWHTPFPIAPGGAARPDSPIAAVTRLNGQLDVFWIGPDGGVGTTWADPGADNGAWHTPFPIAPGGAARPDSPIAAVTRLNGQLDVFWIGPDGGIGTTWADPGADNGAWHTPFPIAPANAARPGSPIAAVTR